MATSSDSLEALIEALVAASWRDRDGIKEKLVAWVRAQPDTDVAVERLEDAKRGIDDLEARWEVDEVVGSFAPPPAEPEPEPEPASDAPPAPGSEGPPGAMPAASDLEVVYDDPRGLILHRSKTGARWFATQRDPMTGSPQTFEVPSTQVEQLKAQLAGSPYWVLGAGA